MLHLLKKHFQILIPLFIVTFFGCLGQTFLIAQFNPYIQSALELSRTEISTVYSLATFLASLNLTFIGTLFDRMKTTYFAAGTVLFISLGLGSLSIAQGVISLFISFYLLRGFGQVTLNLIATTSVSKWFGSNRGKALTLVGFGRSVGEGILPPLVILLITQWGWRAALLILIGMFVVLMIPVIIGFIHKFPTDPLYPEKDEKFQSKQALLMENWSWGKVFKRKWPLLIMITNSLLAFAYTGLFFEQASVANFKSWSMATMATAFTMFSAFQILGNFLWGPLIDKVGALHLQRLTFIPFLLSLIVLQFVQSPVGAFIYLAFAGLAIGFNGMVSNTFWAEVYGIANLGRIKGMSSKISVISTAIAPILFARLLDSKVGMDVIVYALFFLGCLGIFSHLLIHRKFTGAW